MSVFEFWASHREEFAGLVAQHLVLVLVSTLVAVGLGVPLGILAARRPRLGAPIVWLVNAAQTVPSLAMFGFLLPMPFIGGLGARVAITVLIIYALLPIVRTTIAGIRSVDPALVEAGTALGMTPRQLLRLVQLPLALPSIVAGIRVAAVIGVATATIAAAVGAGGLGEYIFRGLSMVDPTVILAGAIPSAVLALLLDGGLTLAERAVRGRLGGGARGGLKAGKVVAVAAVAVAVWLIVLGSGSESRIRIGSKNFTEQVLLGELVAQVLEGRGIPVDRRLNLGGTFICDRAIRSGDIDVYVEYTGTAHTAIFKQAPQTDGRLVLDDVRRRYAEIGVTTFEPLGFENTFAILVRAAEADRLGLQTIADAAPHTPGWRAGFGYEFLERADGYRGLAKAYELVFRDPPRAMDLSLVYRALADRQVDLIAGDATSGLIDAYGLRMLADSRRYFPPYDAVVVARSATLLAQPAVRAALEALSGTLSVADMRAMNRAVDVDRRDAAEVVRVFLRQ